MPLLVNNQEISYETSLRAIDIAMKQPNFKEIIVCKINNVICDLSTVLSDNDKIEFLKFEDDEAKSVFWHSSAHVLGYAILKMFPTALLVFGPAKEDGFFYDVKLDQPFSQSDYEQLESECNKILKKNYKFIKEEISAEELDVLYKDNPFKQHYLKTKECKSIYQIGEFKDLCLGPHIFSTNYIGAFKITKNSSSYFLGDCKNEALQRIAGISFPKKQQMKEYFDNIELAKSRDHRKIGLENNLFFFSQYSPGSCFFLPDGALIYNRLMDYIRSEYKKRGFQEVITPNMFNLKLWEESGHLANYRENMFIIDNEMGLKPMNCPGHCVMFRHGERTYKNMPIRFADFGVLHRNELKGTLSGLTRVRRFQQDDAHIFCLSNQIQTEIEGCLDFMDTVYCRLGFKVEILLSTRPEKYLGEIEQWDAAEAQLVSALGDREYKVNPGDGAFYGPKLDVLVLDALSRKHQCATIQLDFQLPIRFDLKVKMGNGLYESPVMIHRAVFGSIERFMAILIENYGKKLPFWINPNQIAVIPIKESVMDYCMNLKNIFYDFSIKISEENDISLNKKIRNAEMSGFNYIFVVGEQEAERNEISVRKEGVSKVYPIDEILEILKTEVKI